MEHEQCPDKDLDNKMERKRRPPRCKGGKFEQHLESPKMKLKMKAPRNKKNSITTFALS